MVYDQGGDPVNETGGGGMSSGMGGVDMQDIFSMFNGGGMGG